MTSQVAMEHCHEVAVAGTDRCSCDSGAQETEARRSATVRQHVGPLGARGVNASIPRLQEPAVVANRRILRPPFAVFEGPAVLQSQSVLGPASYVAGLSCRRGESVDGTIHAGAASTPAVQRGPAVLRHGPAILSASDPLDDEGGLAIGILVPPIRAMYITGGVACKGCKLEIAEKDAFTKQGFDVELIMGDGTEDGVCKPDANGQECDREACQLGKYKIKISRPDKGSFHVWRSDVAGSPKKQVSGSTTMALGDDVIRQLTCGDRDPKASKASTPVRDAKKGPKGMTRRDSATVSRLYTSIHVGRGFRVKAGKPRGGADTNDRPEYDWTESITVVCTACSKNGQAMDG